MSTLAKFINKLDQLNFTKLVDGKLITDDNNIEVTVSSQLESTNITGAGVQVIIAVRFKGQHIKSWGACDRLENKIIVDWYNSQRSLVREIEYQSDRKNAGIGRAYWDNL